jgi:MHS family proline/betaine transporter-like MFS transporter
MTTQSRQAPADGALWALRRRAIVAAMFGNVVEWFDFVAYGLLASTIADHFFTAAGDSGGAGPLLLTFATFGVGFLARPVGGLLIGLFGDRRGRKPAMILSISLMGLSTGAMAIIPDYATIGIAAPILLVLARLLQGIAAGGEWGGAASFLVEWAPKNRRGLLGSFHTATIFVGTVAASATIAGLSAYLGSDAMSDWGWRIPFAIGAVIALIALPFRTRVEETPIFTEEVTEKVELEPLDKREVGLKLLHTFFLVGMQSAAVYTFTAYLPSFLQKQVKVNGELMGSGMALWSNTIASIIVILVTIASGAVSDRIGRKPGMLLSCVLALVLTYPLLLVLIHTESFAVVVLIHCALAGSAGIFLGCMPAALVELFPTRVRVAGLSTSYNLSSAVFGGFAPLIASALIAATGLPIAAAFWVMFAAVLSAVAVVLLKESRNVDI